MSLKSLLSPLIIVIVAAALAALIQPAHVAELLTPSVARVAISDPAPAACDQQSWYNADRACLSWAAPQSAHTGSIR